MKDTLITRIAGVSALLSVAAQFGAMGIAISLGVRPGGETNFANGAQLLAMNSNHAARVLGVSLATLSPALALPHRSAIQEMCRVAAEVRIFPLLALSGRRSPYVDQTVEDLRNSAYDVSIEHVPYEFQRGGNQMMRIRLLGDGSQRRRSSRFGGAV